MRVLPEHAMLEHKSHSQIDATDEALERLDEEGKARDETLG